MTISHCGETVFEDHGPRSSLSNAIVNNFLDFILTYKILVGITQISPSVNHHLHEADKTRGHSLKLTNIIAPTAFIINIWNNLPADVLTENLSTLKWELYN